MWPEEDRPRERLMSLGGEALKTEELLAILIGNGIPGHSVMELAQAVWEQHERSLYTLTRNSSMEQLCRIQGIGPSKAVGILAALELGKRMLTESVPEFTSIQNCEDAFKVLKPHLMYLQHEEFWCLFLSRANALLAKECLSKGGMTGTVADKRMVFKRALELGAASIIIAHNHPSGNVKPSKSDIALTSEFYKAGDILEIPVIDHLVITASSYTSIREHMIKAA